jgi:gluconate 2-dehydrogenase gamma chain
MSQHDDSDSRIRSRRRFFKDVALIPVATAAGLTSERVASASASDAKAYVPSFFNESEWAFINAAVDRMIPADEVGPGAIELGVPEFLDRHMQTPYAAGAIWYMQGPFVEAAPEFGYQGRMTVRETVRAGIQAIDAYTKKSADAKRFADLDHDKQEQILKSAESGDLKLDGISSKYFFSTLLAEVRNGYFSDPVHGGNKNMGSWKMIGYPGMRADYIDWVTVRDKPYPIPPVDLSGKRS